MRGVKASEEFNSHEMVIGSMPKDSDNALIGRCGLYCGACPIYLSDSLSEELKHKVSEEWGVDLDKSGCKGCNDLTPECVGSKCKIVVCLNSKNISSCFDCDRYQLENCERFEKTYHMCLESSGIDLRQSLERLNAGGTDQWLEKNRQMWVCKSCGTKISWDCSTCDKCGEPLR